MKKAIIFLLIIFLFASCSGKDKSILGKNGHSFSEIKTIKITDGYHEPIKIDKKDFKIIKNYTIEEDAPEDIMGKLFTYPGTTFIDITFENKESLRIYALKDGEFVIRESDEIPEKIYKSKGKTADYDSYFYELYWKQVFENS